LVDDFHAAFGKHHARANHAKGVILEGNFAPTDDASALRVRPESLSRIA
jgi:catalase